MTLKEFYINARKKNGSPVDNEKYCTVYPVYEN